jgi:cellulose biosynthesis protein BcsQ
MKNNLQTVKSSEDQLSFGLRLRKAFRGAQNKEIALKLGLSNAAITTYMQGRMPPPAVLLEIYRKTGCSLHWLMTGEGPEEARHIDDNELCYRSEQSRPHILVVANHGAGEAKSTSATVLAVEFAKRGHRTLLTDDSHGTCAHILFYKIMDPLQTPINRPAYFKGRGHISKRAFFRSPYKGLDLCVSSERAKVLLGVGGIKTFRPDLSNISAEYSIVVIDTESVVNPFESAEVFASLMASTTNVLIPTRGNHSSLIAVEETLLDLAETQKFASNMNLLGIFLAYCTYKGAKLANIRSRLDTLQPGKVFKTVIRQGVDIVDLRFSDMSHLTRQGSRVLVEYQSLASEILSLLEPSDSGNR